MIGKKEISTKFQSDSDTKTDVMDRYLPEM